MMKIERMRSDRDGGWVVEMFDCDGEVSRVLFTGKDDEALSAKYVDRMEYLSQLAATYLLGDASLHGTHGAKHSDEAKQPRTQTEGYRERLTEIRRDAERLQFLEDETNRGMAPQLVFDDDGNWAVSYTGMAPAPWGDGEGHDAPVIVSCLVEPEEWRPSIREAIDAARTKSNEKGCE